jgi:curved DNA-binding protein CbpA
MKTLYDVLGVCSDADDEALKTAYRKAAKAHHPDLNPGDPDAARRFRQIATAIEILRDSEQRAAYDRLLDCGRRQPQLRWTRIIIADAIAAAILVVVLVGGYALIGPTFSTSTTVSEVENSAASRPVATAGEQLTQRTELTGRDEPDGRLEQGLMAVAVSEQLAAAEREAALRREQEERRQAAELDRQKAEREAALRPEQRCRRDEESQERHKAAGPAARDDVTRLEQGLGCERIRPAIIASREEHKARRLATIPETARSAALTSSQAVQEAQTASSSAPPRSFGPVEIAATRTFTRF